MFPEAVSPIPRGNSPVRSDLRLVCFLIQQIFSRYATCQIVSWTLELHQWTKQLWISWNVLMAWILRTMGRKLFVVVICCFLCGSAAICGQRGEMLLAAVASPPSKAPVHIQGRRWLQEKSSRGWKSKIKVLTDSVSGEDCFLVHRQLSFCCVLL